MQIQWTDEMEAFVTKHYCNDLSAAQIAHRLSIKHKQTISRNAVIGKAFRMGRTRQERQTRYSQHTKAKIAALYQDRPDLTLTQIANICGIKTDAMAVCRILRSMGIPANRQA